MNKFIGYFTPSETITLNMLFDGWTFRQEGRFTTFYYADRGELHFSGRSVIILSRILIVNKHTIDDEEEG